MTLPCALVGCSLLPSLGDAHKIRVTLERHAYLHLGNLSKSQSESDREYVISWIRYMQSCPPIHTVEDATRSTVIVIQKRPFGEIPYSISCSNHLSLVCILQFLPLNQASHTFFHPNDPARSIMASWLCIMRRTSAENLVDMFASLSPCLCHALFYYV